MNKQRFVLIITVFFLFGFCPLYMQAMETDRLLTESDEKLQIPSGELKSYREMNERKRKNIQCLSRMVLCPFAPFYMCGGFPIILIILGIGSMCANGPSSLNIALVAIPTIGLSFPILWCYCKEEPTENRIRATERLLHDEERGGEEPQQPSTSMRIRFVQDAQTPSLKRLCYETIVANPDTFNLQEIVEGHELPDDLKPPLIPVAQRRQKIVDAFV